jgi:hypothetical protein
MYRLTFTSGLVLIVESPTLGSIQSLWAAFGSLEDMTPMIKAQQEVKTL